MKTYSLIALTILLFYVVYAVYSAILNPIPALGDSWDYHIPISKLILNGDIFTPHNVKLPQWYYPGTAEAINSLFIFLHIPLTLSNLFAVLVLFFVCWKFGYHFGLDYYESLFFGVTVCTLNGIVRWYNAVSIDVWLVIFFLMSILVLEKQLKSAIDYVKLGILFGLLIGTKFTGVYYLLILILFYLKNIISNLSIKKALVFLLPFSTLGLFWYIRNYVLFKNPFYPVYFLGLPYKINFSSSTVADILTRMPYPFFNGAFGEYKVWLLALPIAFLYLALRVKEKRLNLSNPKIKLILVALATLVIFLISPMNEQPWIIVSSFRYSYPLFISSILSIFLIAKEYHKIELLMLVSFASMIMVTSLNYYPKLVLFYTPLSLLAIYMLERYRRRIENYLMP